MVEDHAIVRDGFRRLLRDVDADLVFGEADTAADALSCVRRRSWDVVVLDLSLHQRLSLELLKEIRALRPELPVLVMTMYPEKQYALRCIRAGAQGYVTKDSSSEVLIAAVEKVAGGGRYVSQTLAEHLSARLADGEGTPLHEALSDREVQVVTMLARGLAVKEIAFDLGLSDKTVSTYRTRALDKLQMRTTAELMRYAIRANLVE